MNNNNGHNTPKVKKEHLFGVIPKIKICSRSNIKVHLPGKSALLGPPNSQKTYKKKYKKILKFDELANS